MKLACLICGHDFELVNRRQQDPTGVTSIAAVCQSCGEEKWIDEGIACEKFDCEEYVVGMNYLHQQNPKKEYSQRCYRCSRCNDSWYDEDRDMLEGKWYAIDGKAIHASELGEKKPSILLQIQECKGIKEVRNLIQKYLNPT